MMKKRYWIFLLPLWCMDAFAKCDDLNEVMQSEAFKTLREEQKQEVLSSANWSENDSLVSFCYESSCFVIKTCEVPLKIINISDVVKTIPNKLESNPQYDRRENRPIITSEFEQKILARWSQAKYNPEYHDNPEIIGTLIRTRIWKGEQRYTLYKGVLIENNEIIHQ